jgi:hypothetical protein
MEEGKIQTAWAVFDRRSPSMYIEACATLSKTLLAWGEFGSISAHFGEPASRFTNYLMTLEYMEEDVR